MSQALGPPCSPTDIAEGRFVEVSFIQNASYCALGPALISMGLAKSLQCCSTDECNVQIPASNMPVTTAASAAPTLQCYFGADNNVQLMTVTSIRYVEH